MMLHEEIGRTPVWHDCRSGFGDMLRRALIDKPVIAAHGPIYEKDPAESILEPFYRSMKETNWDLEENSLAPDEVFDRVCCLRSEAIHSQVEKLELIHDDLVDWARAGLVLEIARRRGINLISPREIARPNWKLKGTMTGRFGCDTTKGESILNPLSIGPRDRARIIPSDYLRQIVVLDFRGMDVCSMVSIVPGLAEIYKGYRDPHQRTAELTGLTREKAKIGLLSWAYGAAIDLQIADTFQHTFSAIRDFTRGMNHGDFPRMVQMTSALAFRAALSKSLPLLVTEKYIPMFTVHDELVVDSSDLGCDQIIQLVEALETGASKRVGVQYSVGVSTGYTYDEAKSIH